MKHLSPMAPRCRPLLMIALAAVLVGAEPTRNHPSDFAFDGRPVHPMSVQPLVGDLADEQPRIAAVDLNGSAKNKSNRADVKAEGGTVTARDGEGFVAYRHIGTTPGGLHVLVVSVNGGGSGVFEDALWVKTVHDRVWDDGKLRDRTMLVRVGQFPLGDGDNGLIRLDDSKLFIGKSRYRDKDTTITLE